MNRECAKLKGRGDGDEFVGPAENLRDNIKKQIRETDDETTNIQKDWITNQIELIRRQEERAKIDRQIDDQRTKKAILD